jgi:hypothetical protein
MNFPIVGEDHGVKHRRSDFLHHIHVAMSKENVVVQRGINDLNVNQDHFILYLYGEILENPLEFRWVAMIGPEGDSIRG